MRQYLQGWLLVAAALTTAYASAAQPTNVLPVPTHRVDIFRCDTTYNYTPGNRLGGIAYPSGTVATYGRDANGRVNAISAQSAGQTTTVPVVSDVTYLPFGPVQDVVYGNGTLTLKRTFDLNYQGTDIQGLGLDLHVRRDGNGNIVALHEGRFITHAAEQRYRYDALQRLTDKIGPYGLFSDHYDYNATGDRQSRVRAGFLAERYTYQPGTHRLGGIAKPGWHGWKTANVLSDAAGNIARMPRQGQALDLDYAANNRLAQVAKAGRIVGSYVYDANGLRAQKTAGSHARQFIYDDHAHLLGDYTPDTQQKREYLWLEGALVATLDTSAQGVSVHYVGTDFLGTPRRVVNIGGYPVWGWAYAGEAFGDAPALGSYDLAMRFPGQYHDAESGLNYNVHRDYDAATGRYVESDPIGLRGGITTYAYVGGNPLIHLDPRGLVRWKGTVATAGAAAVVGASLYRFDLKSECVNGKQGWALVYAVGPTFGVEVKGAPPIGITGSSVSFDDDLSEVNPYVFNGTFITYGTGIALGIGYGCSATRMGGHGGALSSGVDSGAYSVSCGGQYGLDASLATTGGSATVVDGSVKGCDCK